MSSKGTTDFVSEWQRMKKRGVNAYDDEYDTHNSSGVSASSEIDEAAAEHKPPLTMKEYARRVRQSQASHRDVSPETREEQHLYYSKSYRGDWFFRWLHPARPDRARLRVERLYWESWHTFCLGVFLSCFGSMLLFTGMAFLYFEKWMSVRGWSMIGAALLPVIPGYYALFVIFKYICCCKGYNLSLFP